MAASRESTTPRSTGHSPRHLLGPVLGAVILGAFLTCTFVGALHSPKPHDLDVGVVGPPQMTGTISRTLDQHAPGAFDFHRYDSPAEAQQAVRHHDVAGAFVPGRSSATLYTASAGGAIVASNLREVFGLVAAANHVPLTVTDVVPAPKGDSAGLSSFLLVVSLLIPSMVLGGGLGIVGRSQSALRGLLAGLAGAVLLGLGNLAVANLAFDALDDHFWALWGVASLASAAIALPALALARAVGVPGIALVALAFVFYGMPASGAAVGPAFIPDWLRSLTAAFPAGETIPTIRNVAYFDAHHTALGIWSLAAWAVVGALAALALGRRGSSRQAVAEPEPALASVGRL